MYLIKQYHPEKADETSSGFEWSEMGMANLFGLLYSHEARYCPEHKSWYTYAIHESKEFLQELLEDIIEIANELGITVNTRKTRICKLSEHWRFLQVQYSLTDTGRVIQKINPKRLTAMRRKMKKLAPKLTEKEFTDFYKSWFKNHYKIMSKKQRSNMDTLFNQLKEVTKCTLSPLPMAKS